MAIVNPYLTFKGNCEEAFNHYQSVFGGEFAYVGRFKDMPPQEGVELSEADQNKIMHIALPLSKDNILMGSDTGGWAPELKVGNNFSLSVSAESKEQADRFFIALSKGGNVTMPMAPTFWGDYFGMCTDAFGINWMISFNENRPE